MKKNILISGFVILSALGLGLYLNSSQSFKNVEIHSQFVADLSDDRIMMGASHNVFVGKVTQEIGTTDIDIGPETQFKVEILDNMKGDLAGEVTVNQQAGYNAEGVLYNPHGVALIATGNTYLFNTRYNPEQDWYTVSAHPNGLKLISEDASLQASELKNLAEQDKKVKKFREAYKNEILLDADIRTNNTRNSYKSLSED